MIGKMRQSTSTSVEDGIGIAVGVSLTWFHSHGSEVLSRVRDSLSTKH